MSFLPFTYYITSVDLVAYVAGLGFHLDKEKSTRSCSVMKDGFGNSYLIRRNSANNNWFYTNPNDAEDRGNIVDLIAKRNNLDKKKDFLKINQLLASINGNLPVIGQTLEKKTKSQFDTYLLRPCEDFSYLLKRGISEKTFLGHPFKGSVMGFTHHLPNGRSYTNLAFPLWDKDDKIVGAELKNFNFKSCAEGSLKENGVWQSNLEGCHFLGLSENPIDAMSYHQLNEANGLKMGHIAFGGGISQKQVDLVNQRIQQHGLERIGLLFDNDEGGKFFDILLSCKLVVNELGQKFHFGAVLDKSRGVLDLQFFCELMANEFFRLKHLCLDNFQSLEGFMGLSLLGEKLHYKFQIEKTDFFELSQMVLTLRGLNNVVEVLKPSKGYKDFNDQLMDRPILNK